MHDNFKCRFSCNHLNIKIVIFPLIFQDFIPKMCDVRRRGWPNDEVSIKQDVT